MKRYVTLAVGGVLILIVGAVGLSLWAFGDERSSISEPIEDFLTSSTWYMLGAVLSAVLLVGGAIVAVLAVARLNRSLLSNWLSHPGDVARLLSRKVQLAKGPRIVAIGGGSGLSNLLRGLRKYTSNLTAVVAVSDNGGSSGRLREAYDMPAPGDLTDCLAALSDNESELTRLLQFRFTRGEDLMGHTFGNLLIATLTEMEGDFGQALRVINQLLNLSGSVYPATAQAVHLVVMKEGGAEVKGEKQVREVPGAVETLRIEPPDPIALPEVVKALREADLVVLGPGSLFSSTLPPLVVPSIRDALNESDAKLVYVTNIMTEVGETDGFNAVKHVLALAGHGVKLPDVAVVNNAPIDQERMRNYISAGSELVTVTPSDFAGVGVELVRAPILGKGEYAQHDSDKLAEVLVSIAAGVPYGGLKGSLGRVSA